MPYIKDEEKREMADSIEQLLKFIASKGDLNYAICEIVGRLILESEKMSYTTMSEWIDAVHDAEAELRRRILTPYEYKMMLLNGDVPSFTGIRARLSEEKQ